MFLSEINGSGGLENLRRFNGELLGKTNIQRIKIRKGYQKLKPFQISNG
jgi:hypothetical protein